MQRQKIEDTCSGEAAGLAVGTQHFGFLSRCAAQSCIDEASGVLWSQPRAAAHKHIYVLLMLVSGQCEPQRPVPDHHTHQLIIS